MKKIGVLVITLILTVTTFGSGLSGVADEEGTVNLSVWMLDTRNARSRIQNNQTISNDVAGAPLPRSPHIISPLEEGEVSISLVGGSFQQTARPQMGVIRYQPATFNSIPKGVYMVNGTYREFFRTYHSNTTIDLTNMPDGAHIQTTLFFFTSLLGEEGVSCASNGNVSLDVWLIDASSLGFYGDTAGSLIRGDVTVSLINGSFQQTASSHAGIGYLTGRPAEFSSIPKGVYVVEGTHESLTHRVYHSNTTVDLSRMPDGAHIQIALYFYPGLLLTEEEGSYAPDRSVNLNVWFIDTQRRFSYDTAGTSLKGDITISLVGGNFQQTARSGRTHPAEFSSIPRGVYVVNGSYRTPIIHRVYHSSTTIDLTNMPDGTATIHLLIYPSIAL
jgi:hypothetical protein